MRRTTIMTLLVGAGIWVSANQDALHRWAQARVADGQAGAVVVTWIDRAGVSSRGCGHRDGAGGPPPDADSRFLIGSVTKPFTHLLLARLVAEGELRYDQPLAGLLPPDFTPGNPAVARITLQALATHGSGLPRLPPNLILAIPDDPLGLYDDAALLLGLRVTRQGQPLGTYYGYSNFGVAVLGQVLGQHVGGGYRRALRDRVLVPLGLTDTAFEPGPRAVAAWADGRSIPPWRFHDAMAAAGGLWSTPADLTRFLQAALGGVAHPLGDAFRLGRDVLPGAGDPRVHLELSRVWHVHRADGRPVYWHNGSTLHYWSFVGFRPDTGQAAIILLAGAVDPTEAGLRALGVEPKPPLTGSVDVAGLGRYTFPDGTDLEVVEAGGRLWSRVGGQAAQELFRVDGDRYALHDVDASLRFMRVGEAVTAVEMIQDGRVRRARRPPGLAIPLRWPPPEGGKPPG